VLSEGERRRCEQIAAELRRDDELARLDAQTRRKAPRSKSRRARCRTLLEWAEQYFDERMRNRDRTR